MLHNITIQVGLVWFCKMWSGRHKGVTETYGRDLFGFVVNIFYTEVDEEVGEIYYSFTWKILPSISIDKKLGNWQLRSDNLH